MIQDIRYVIVIISAVVIVATVSFIAVVWYYSRSDRFARLRNSQYNSIFDNYWRKSKLYFKRSKLKGIAFLIYGWFEWKRRVWVGQVDIAIVSLLVMLSISVLGTSVWDAIIAFMDLIKN